MNPKCAFEILFWDWIMRFLIIIWIPLFLFQSNRFLSFFFFKKNFILFFHSFSSSQTSRMRLFFACLFLLFAFYHFSHGYQQCSSAHPYLCKNGTCANSVESCENSCTSVICSTGACRPNFYGCYSTWYFWQTQIKKRLNRELCVIYLFYFMLFIFKCL